VESVAMAIQTLSTFSFEDYEEEIAVFVKKSVLFYLDNVYAEIRKAAAQAGCLLYVKKKRKWGKQINRSNMTEIMDKFMSVAISDNEDEIRMTMLQALNENFDYFLNTPNNLKKLFLCLNDSCKGVQQLSLIILSRLAKQNPSNINPFLKKTLYQYLSTLTFENGYNIKQKIDLITLLTCLIQYGGEIVKPHSDIIAKILLYYLRSKRTSASLMPALFNCFSKLSGLGDLQILQYQGEVISLILLAMQDKSYAVKRESAVCAMIEINKNTGYVVLPYYVYPQMLEVILGLLKNEAYPEMRRHCLRLIGCLGAIDNYFYKRVLSRIGKHKDGDVQRIIN